MPADTAPIVIRSRRRLVIDLPPELYDGLRRLADANYRDGKREAIRLLAEGVERELAGRPG